MQNTNNRYLTSHVGATLGSYLSQPLGQLIQSRQIPVRNTAPQITPEEIAYINEQYQKAIQPRLTPQQQKLADEWRGKDVYIEGHPLLSELATPFYNAPGDLAQIGTGFANLVGRLKNDPIGTLKEGWDYSTDYLNHLVQESEVPNTNYDTGMVGNILGGLNQALPVRAARYGMNIAKDAWNFLPGSLPILNTKTVGSIVEDIKNGKGESAYEKLKEAGAGSWDKIKYDPLITALEVAPNTTVGLAGKGFRKVGNLAEKYYGIPIGETSTKVAKAVQTIESKFNKDKYELLRKSKDFRHITTDDFVKLLEDYTEEGVGVPERLEPLREKFKSFNDKYLTTIDDNALVNPNELAALEYVQRKTGKTMQEIRRELTPQLEALQAGIEDPSLIFKNRLSDFEHSINSMRKASNDKSLFSNTRRIADLNDVELKELSKYFTPEDISMLISEGADVKAARKYLGSLVRESWTPSKVSDAAMHDIKFQENMGKLASLAAETGNEMYRHLYDGMKLANADRIGNYTFANAKVPKTGLVSNEGRRFQGKSSSREYGTATYEEIAKAYKNMDEFIEDITLQRVKDEIGRNLLETGTIDGVSKLAKNVAAEDMRYLNPELLADGRLSEAIAKAGTTATDGAVAMDKYTLKALEHSIMPTGTPYKTGVLGDVYNLFKEVALASGTYLGGNFISGLVGTMANSGPNIIRDTIAAIGTRGRLAKELGVYRPIRPAERRYSTKLAKGISTVGGWFGTGLAPRADALMQNMFAEINAHAGLRKLGVPSSSRISSIAELNKVKLSQLIEDIRLNSMMNNRFRIIPRGTARDIVGIANPFLDWTDTATQVSWHLLKEHPILAGAVASKTLGEIAFDRELQQRLKLNVTTDKPLVTYIPDEKTGGAKEVSINFLPQLTTLDILRNPTKLVVGVSGAPFLTALYEASKGNNVYGKPMRRTHGTDSFQDIQGDRRYRINPETRMVEPINETQADEMLSTAIKNLVGPVNLWNRTVAPIGTDIVNRITGSDYRYYMPYGQSILGSWKTGQPERGGFSRNILSTGDPRNPREVKDILEALGTYYERPYYDDTGLTGNQIRRIIRHGVRQNLIDQGDY